ncbi:MAG TPA: AAA family ATPase [bacterium]|nr:AAA family ATPase [bacterium]HOL48613.1 AAA family ATPase [bacterium]HPQ19047.1 AAA family ATPase [bacterium]
MNNDIELLKKAENSFKKLNQEISKIIIGQEDIIKKIIIALLSGGHCLIIGVPGLAKTMIIKTIAQLVALSFKRIQFTPDLMPSDITGIEIIDFDNAQNKRELRFVKGPIFANIILADEINRTPPKTQSALLEAMEEKTVTISGLKYKLETPFLVLATQNPIEQEGTYPLPEAQLDRFMFNLIINYPEKEKEILIAKLTTSDYNVELNPIITKEEIIEIQKLVKRLPISDEVIKYAVEIARLTRREEKDTPDFIKEYVEWGAGIRASQNLILGGKANAIINGKECCDFEDINSVIYETLRHRIILNFHAQAKNINSDFIISELLKFIKDKFYK